MVVVGIKPSIGMIYRNPLLNFLLEPAQLFLLNKCRCFGFAIKTTRYVAAYGNASKDLSKIFSKICKLNNYKGIRSFESIILTK